MGKMKNAGFEYFNLLFMSFILLLATLLLAFLNVYYAAMYLIPIT